MHFDDEQIQRALHGELDQAARGAIDGHLATCEPCRILMEEARREERWILDLLARIDSPAPR